MSYFQPRPYKTIKHSMLETIGKEWNMQGGTDSLDPFVQMLLSACADELSRIEEKFHSSQSEILNRLAELLMPDEWDIPKPAFGVLKVKQTSYETAPSVAVKPQNHFLGTVKVDESYEEYYLSATNEFQVLGAEVAFLVNSVNFSKVEDVSKKTSLKGNTQLHSHTIWLGIEYLSACTNLQGLRFFFDWTVDDEKNKYYPYIKQSKWYFNGNDITPAANETSFKESTNPNTILNYFENKAQNFYRDAFVTITKSVPLEKEKFETPAELRIFHDEIINQRIDNLLWIKVEFPRDMPHEAIKRLYCTTNAFPVLNRKINEPITYKIYGESNLIPIVTKYSEEFMAVEKILGNKGRQLMYSLRRKGIERFDNRDAKELLRYVTNVLQDETHAFKELNYGNFISENIEEVKKNFERILQKLNENLDNWQNKIYVYVEGKESKEEEAVDVFFWTTSAFEQYPKSLTEFLSDNAEGISSDGLLLTIQRGRKRPTESEKIASFRHKLTSRGRVVTHQDIRLFCMDYVGDKLADVEVKKDVMIGQNSSTGFTRYIHVKLIPKEENPNRGEWAGMCHDISLLLNEQMQVLPIMVDYK
ncbi:hypothetical protein [Emticicia sp. 17c]|uniref:hypothetical protein n=1 Tax=Emticicia sp. 17c TaxID=3127704 RepID=UPI00301CA16E